jgi:hypothetical protein
MTDTQRARKSETAPVRPPHPPPPSLRLHVPADGPVAAFAALVDAIAIRDYRTATAIRRRLYKAGWSIVPPKTVSWPGAGGRS